MTPSKFSNNKSSPNIEIWFNDNGVSEIDPPKLKIDRVEELASEIFIPDNVRVKYSSDDLNEKLATHYYP